MNSKDIIKQHLESMAAKDKAFAKVYAKESKNLDECIEYIRSRAKKEAVSGCAIIEDSVVFGWASHYYQEDNLKEEKSESIKAQSTKEQEPKTAVKVSITKKRKTEKKSDYIELDLFGGTL